MRDSVVPTDESCMAILHDACVRTLRVRLGLAVPAILEAIATPTAWGRVRRALISTARLGGVKRSVSRLRCAR